jgi:CheY-like chemotaxis protein
MPDGPRWAWADARALEHVLVNLLSNAIQYNRPGGAVEVTIDTDGPRWVIEITDQGRGLSADERARLFQPFQRLGSPGQRTGRGLGLVTSRRLVETMDGSLTLHSTPGQGTRARIGLPRADEAGVPSTAAAALTLPAALDESRPARTVLYIEDEPLNVLLMEEVFRVQTAWALAIARDGEHGLALAAETQPDLLLIDMNLPDMNGLQLIGRLRADPVTASLHCIALSADAMPDQIAAALAAGFDDYWTKPIDVPRMLGAMAQAFDHPRTGA